MEEGLEQSRCASVPCMSQGPPRPVLFLYKSTLKARPRGAMKSFSPTCLFRRGYAKGTKLCSLAFYCVRAIGALAIQN